MKTEAFQLVKQGDAFNSFQLAVIELHNPAEDEVQISVESFGLNYADVMARRGLYREAPPLPAVIGYEVVGTITKTGKNVDTSWFGKHVVAFTRFGGYARAVNTNILAVADIGEMDAGEALCLATQYVTAYYMSRYLLNIHEGEKVLVHAAAGGVGTALIQLLKANKAYVIAKTGSDAKIDYLKELGSDFVVNYRTSDYSSSILEHIENDKLAFKELCRILKKGGQMYWSVPSPTILDETIIDDPTKNSLQHYRWYGRDFLETVKIWSKENNVTTKVVYQIDNVTKFKDCIFITEK